LHLQIKANTKRAHAHLKNLTQLHTPTPAHPLTRSPAHPLARVSTTARGRWPVKYTTIPLPRRRAAACLGPQVMSHMRQHTSGTRLTVRPLSAAMWWSSRTAQWSKPSRCSLRRILTRGGCLHWCELKLPKVDARQVLVPMARDARWIPLKIPRVAKCSTRLSRRTNERNRLVCGCGPTTTSEQGESRSPARGWRLSCCWRGGCPCRERLVLGIGFGGSMKQ
jgi:hypothetical protein